ncbi:hypothetical protein [Lyngbya confervoides]|uniref:Uncharacterized protein n=1 Tax=Lyngbya confervoides BDU141951 TaxID=1574623 RepID=A0ABD4T760_9CYAN|nr:hypothetical protein [Lyngbya confervoides]MCM1984330.1 hypothetical protein [Lyngbya confervoides BDU141951]
MTHPKPETVYEKLQYLDHGDIAISAMYRQWAQEVLTDPEVAMPWKEAIAERLNHANQLLGSQTAGENDSY